MNLEFPQHASEVAVKANRVLACMKRNFIDLNEFVLSRINGSTNIRIWKCNLETPLCIRST